MTALPESSRVLAVTAHPDDESFGLGAIIDHYVTAGARVEVLCLTRGEASTLGAHPELSAQRERELASACDALGIGAFELCDFPDGGLAELPPATLEDRIERTVAALDPDTILTYDPLEGVTGHPDHRAASEAALAVARRRGLPVLGWALPLDVAETVNAEFGTGLAGYAAEALDIALPITRETQLAAARAHSSQAVPGSLLWRRLELLGDREYLRHL